MSEGQRPHIKCAFRDKGVPGEQGTKCTAPPSIGSCSCLLGFRREIANVLIFAL